MINNHNLFDFLTLKKKVDVNNEDMVYRLIDIVNNMLGLVRLGRVKILLKSFVKKCELLLQHFKHLDVSKK